MPKLCTNIFLSCLGITTWADLDLIKLTGTSIAAKLMQLLYFDHFKAPVAQTGGYKLFETTLFW